MLQITPVLFILGLNFKERRGQNISPLDYFVGSMARGTILNHTVRTIIFLILLLLLTTVVARTRTM